MGRPSGLSLEDLTAEVEQRLVQMGLLEGQADGRVAALPDLRTVRYYGTLGLVDRPSIDKSGPVYSQRHVLQIVAIKAYQAHGLRLADIQKALYAKSNIEIENILLSLDKKVKKSVPPLIRWKEVVIEPGMRLMVDEMWSFGTSPEILEERIRVALAALAADKGGPDR